jgi:putative transposase
LHSKREDAKTGVFALQKRACKNRVFALQKKRMIYKIYSHNPPHFFSPNATYMVTGATYKKRRIFCTYKAKEILLSSIIFCFEKYDWEIKAYVILDNHYHLLLMAPYRAEYLSKIISELHRYTSLRVNQLESKTGRKVWWNYWDTCISYERSYFARMNYIHFNPVKHGYVDSPENWFFSSYQEFYNLNPLELERIEKEYQFDKVKVKDDF